MRISELPRAQKIKTTNNELRLRRSGFHSWFRARNLLEEATDQTDLRAIARGANGDRARDGEASKRRAVTCYPLQSHPLNFPKRH
jgi:hypothetical protein